MRLVNMVLIMTNMVNVMFKQTQYINENFTTLVHFQLLSRAYKNKLSKFKIKRDDNQTTLIFDKIHVSIDSKVKMYNKSVMINDKTFEITADIKFNVTSSAIEIHFLNQSIYIVPVHEPKIVQSNMNSFDLFISLFDTANVNSSGKIELGTDNSRPYGYITFKDRTEFIKSGKIQGLKKEHGSGVYRVINDNKETLLRISAIDLSFIFNGWL